MIHSTHLIHRILSSLCTLLLFAGHALAEKTELEQWVHPFGVEVGKTKWSEVESRFANNQKAWSVEPQIFHGLPVSMPGWQEQLVFGIAFAPVTNPVTLSAYIDPNNIIQRFSIITITNAPNSFYNNTAALLSSQFPDSPVNTPFDHDYRASFLYKMDEESEPYYAELILANRQFQTENTHLYLKQVQFGELTRFPQGLTVPHYEEAYYTDQVPEPFSSLPWAGDAPMHATSLTIVSPEYLRVFEENLRKKAEDPETDDNVRAMLREAFSKYGPAQTPD